jgi:hypothetical protein
MTRSVTLTEGKGDDAIVANCSTCLRRGRRGGMARFGGPSKSASAFSWARRHQRH